MTKFRASHKTAALCALVILSLGSIVAGCAQDDRPISEIPSFHPTQSAGEAQSGATDSADTVMSGHYEVSPEGKLLRPKSIYEITPPELPEVAKVYDQNGADAFMQYFVDVMDYTWLSGDTTLLRAISADSCTWCLGMANETDKRTANAGWSEHVNSHILNVEHTVESPAHPGLWDTVLHIESGDHNVYDGKSIQKYPRQKYRFHAQMRFEDGAWKITGAEGNKE